MKRYRHLEWVDQARTILELYLCMYQRWQN